MINQEGAQDGAGRRAQILEAALHVMAEHGFHGASIKRIAARAGLKSPALIYWYFKDKQALFDALLDNMAPFLALVADPEPLLDLPPDIVLPRLADGFLRTTSQPHVGRLVRLLLSESARHPAVASFFAERGPLVILNFLERYLAHQAALGHLRPHDSAAAARVFMGMLIVYLLGHELFPVIGKGFPPADDYAPTVVAIFLNGLQQAPSAAATVR
ncbi:MAG TPA: TetR/AcrR family transcriptional regulator [Chloroflexota bacterium]